jgi:cytochrome c553
MTFGSATTGLSPARIGGLRTETGEAGSFRGGAGIAALVPGLPAQPAVPPEGPADAIDAVVTDLVFAGRGDVWACASCHGDLGQGNESTPRLAGLPAGYLAKQLRDFRDGTRQSESMRLVAAGLSDEEMSGLGAYFAGLRVPSNAEPNLSADLARGEQLALHGDFSLGVPACFSCHGPAGFGVAPEFPALAAQHAPYTATQLAAWAGGTRSNAPLGLMANISAALSSGDRRAVADYLASLPPVPAGSVASNSKESRDVN